MGKGQELSKSKSPQKKASVKNISKTKDEILESFAKEFKIPEEILKAAETLRKFQSLSKSEKVKKAKKIITDAIIDAEVIPDALFPIAVAQSESLIKGYSTLDEPHRTEITKLMQQISSYLNDSTRKRPFNALMIAAPGAGKSHFIHQLCLAMANERVKAVTFNMATMRTADDLAQSIDELRNLKINDRFPLLFLDEFDSDESNYAALLPLLWDGELHIGHRDLKLGKSVIVLAGSNPDLPKEMEKSASMKMIPDSKIEQNNTGKLVDLLSRINGGIITIPDLDLRTESRDRRVDKVCVAISLIKLRFGDKISIIPRSLLRFIAHSNFRYGVRSIAHFIDLIDIKANETNKLDVSKLNLPLHSEEELKESSLKLHLIDKDQAFGIVNRWAEFSKDTTLVDLKQDNSLLNILPFIDLTNSSLLKSK